MRRGFRLASVLGSLLILLLLAAACQQAAPAPTAVPAKPTAAAASQPTAAPAPTVVAQPTAAPAAKDPAYPEKGRPISLIVGFPPGGGADLGARTLAAPLEKELGVPVTVVNRDGAGSQVGITAAATAKPDGYTLGYANWATFCTIYLDPERAGGLSRKSVQVVARHLLDPMVLVVPGNSPYKTLKEFLDAAKAKPDTIKMGVGGLWVIEHLMVLQMERLSGAKFSIVSFAGGSPMNTALLGGHIDASVQGTSGLIPQLKSGELRALATIEKPPVPTLEGVPSMEDLGYKGFYGLARTVFVPAGTPKEIVDTLTQAVKRATETKEHAEKVPQLYQVSAFMEPAPFEKQWDDLEVQVKALLEAGKKQQR